MKWFYWSLLILFCIRNLFSIGVGVDNLALTTQMYKNALDAGAAAAAEYKAYDTQDYIYNQSIGYGIGMGDKNNIPVDRDESLKWFYRLFFRNLSICDESTQVKIKKYLPMKALVCFDRLMIADIDDAWVYDKEYLIDYRGKTYGFTLSDQVYDVASNTWKRDSDIGLTEAERKQLLTSYIRDELNTFLENRENKKSEKHYQITFSLDDVSNKKLSDISGTNFIVFCEGLPLLSYNPFNKEHLYLYGLGGSEIIRE